MSTSTETILEFVTRRAESTKAQALAARTTITSTRGDHLVLSEHIDRLMQSEAYYAEWETLRMVAEGRAQLGEPDDVTRVTLAGYLKDRILGFSIGTSTSVVDNHAKNLRLGALQEILRAVTR